VYHSHQARRVHHLVHLDQNYQPVHLVLFDRLHHLVQDCLKNPYHQQPLWLPFFQKDQ